MSTTLITGATDGIGLALARLLAARGERLVLIGRRPLEEAQAVDAALFTAATYCQADLAQLDCAEPVLAFLAAQGVEQIDVAVQNAGVGYVGAIGDQSAESIDQLINVNLHAPIALTQALTPHLSRAGGTVVFISSVATALPAATYAVYAATKAALDGFARSLRVEWAGRIAVQVLHPGATRTGMHAKVGMPREQWQGFVSAESVAKRIAAAIQRGRPQATIGAGNRLLRTVGRLAAPLIDYATTRRAAAPAHPAGRHCVVTGGADGIGRALVARYAAAGYAVTIVDRDGARARALAAELDGASVVLADLRHDWAWVAELPPVDVFIHNAGISAVGRFETLPLAALQAVIDVNLRAPLQLTARLLAHNLLADGASVVLLSSLSHFVGYPGAAVYAATKDGLAHYGRSVAAVLGRSHTVLSVFPGPTRTAHARRYSPDNRREATRMPPERVADAIFVAQQAGRRRLAPGMSARVMMGFGRIAPRIAERLMARMLLSKIGDDPLL